MDIWLIEDGEKTGPFPDYHIREKLESGALSPDTPAWHEGRTDWTTLGGMELFVRPAARKITPPPLPPAAPQAIADDTGWLLLFRRFLARWCDLKCYSACWWLGMTAAGADLRGLMESPWILPTLYFPWFAIEAAFLHLTGATPGKFLMGLRVANDDGSRLTLKQSSLRSFRVLVLGIGFGWSFLAIICQALSAHAVKRIGRTLWDRAGGHRVETRPVSFGKPTILVFVFLAASLTESWVTFPYMAEEMTKRFPQLKPMIETHPFHRPGREMKSEK